jgi:hypothetical protein
MNHQPKNGTLFLYTHGRLVRITATAESFNEANALCLADESESVIDTLGPLVLLAKQADLGIPFTLPPSCFKESIGAHHAFSNPSARRGF